MDAKIIKKPKAEKLYDQMNEFCAQFAQEVKIRPDKKVDNVMASSFIQPQNPHRKESDEYEEPFSDQQCKESLEGRDNQIDSSSRPKRQCVKEVDMSD